MFTKNKCFNLDGDNFSDMLARNYNLNSNDFSESQQKAEKKRPLQQILNLNTDLEYNSLLLSSHSTLEPAIQTLMLSVLASQATNYRVFLHYSILPSRTTNFVHKLLGQILQPTAETNHGEVPQPSVNHTKEEFYNPRVDESSNFTNCTVSVL
jgi:hypothetical protein